MFFVYYQNTKEREVVVYRWEYAMADYDQAQKLLTHTWFSESENLDDRLYRQEMMMFQEAILSYRPKYILVDQRDFNHVISINTEQWISDNIHKTMIEIECQKLAFIVPENKYCRLGISQALQDKYAKQLNVRFFDTRQEAIEWLGLGNS